MKIVITDQHGTITEQEELVQNSENIYTVEFAFDESWEGFAKTVIFVAGYTNIPVPLLGDSCMIPSQCLKRAGAFLKIGVYGTRGEERKPTVWCKTNPIQSGASMDGMVSLPAPDVYAQMLEIVQNVYQDAELIREMVDHAFLGGISGFKLMDQGEYQALPEKDPTVIYFIRG